MSIKTRFLFPALAMAIACGNTTEPPVEDDLFGLDDFDTVRAGAPSNDELPTENKFDEVLPESFDLIDTQSPVRSQGRRGVCSIFGTAAYVEHLYRVEGSLPDLDLSEQFLQWSTKFENRSFLRSSGSNTNVNLQTMQRYGTVLESVWPYESAAWTADDLEACGNEEESSRPTECYTNGSPPMEALMADRIRLPSRGRWINTSADSLKAHMVNTGTAVQAGGDFYYQAWGHGGSRIPRYSDYRSLGYVVTPSQEDIDSSLEHRAGHSFLLVGYDDNLEVQRIAPDGTLMVDDNGDPVMDTGFFLFKNSWGTGWAQDNPFGAGYGWISYEYVDRFLSAYVTRVPEVNVREVCGDGRDNDFNELTDCADPACESDRVCLDPADTYESQDELEIPDNDPEGITSTITVADGGQITGLAVDLLVQHTYRGDLRITLTKGDTTVVLHDEEGGAEDDVIETYDLSDFDGQDSAGDWVLAITDNAGQDVGTLVSWSLNFTRCEGDSCESMPSTLSAEDDSLLVIDDNGSVSTSLDVAGEGTITAARITVNLLHEDISELTIEISREGGERVVLLDGESVDDEMLIRTFTIDDFNGEDGAGNYELFVTDNATGNEGFLNAWGVDLSVQ